MLDRSNSSLKRPQVSEVQDSLSDLLSHLGPSIHSSTKLYAGGAWALTVPGLLNGFKITAMVSGSCWLAIDELGSYFKLNEGDCFLNSTASQFRIGSDLSLEGLNARDLYRHPSRFHGIAHLGEKVDTVLFGGRFTFQDSRFSMLIGSLPQIIHIKAGTAANSIIPWILERLMAEGNSDLPGSALIANHLVRILLVEVIRLELSSVELPGNGLLAALLDKKIGKALRLVHQQPNHDWTLSQLTTEAGMSRTAFTVLFKKLVGVSPLDYVLRWKMQLAAETLRDREKSVSEVAYSLGYESESSFSRAFKRVMGTPPKHYQRA